MKTRCLFIGGYADGEWREVDDLLAEQIVPESLAMSPAEITPATPLIHHLYFRERYFVGPGEIESVYIAKDVKLALKTFRFLFDNYKPEKKA